MSELNGKKDAAGQAEDLPSVIIDEAALNQLNQTEQPGNQTAEAKTAPVAAETEPVAETGADAASEEDLAQAPESQANETAEAAGTDDLDIDEEMEALAKREQKMKLAGKIAIVAVAVLISCLLVYGIMRVVGDNVADGVTALTGGTESGVTVVTPAIKAIDASGCKRGQWYLDGNQLVFKNCAVPVFHEK
jgi:hypothetical protein